MTVDEVPTVTLAALAALAAATAVALVLPARARSPLTGVAGTAIGAGDGARAREGTWLRAVATAGVVLAALLLVGGRAGVVVAVLAGSGCWWVLGRREAPSARRRRERLAAAVPHAVDLLSACLTAGLSPSAAVEQIAGAVDPPLSEELAALSARLRLGVDPVTAWQDLAAHPQLGPLGRTVSRAVESGASVADAMLRLAEDLRRQRGAEVESRARTVGVRAALPLGLCLLPAFVLVGVVPLVAGALSVLTQP